jgi:RHS repeat-associated protein
MPSVATAVFRGAELYSARYERDAAGRVVRAFETVQGETTPIAYTYDACGRLTGVDRGGLPALRLEYDANSNAVSRVRGGAEATATFDGADRVLSCGGETFQWTPCGELAARTEGARTTSYVYDAAGRLRTVTPADGEPIVYAYDGLGRRVGRRRAGDVRGLLWLDALRPAAEVDGDGRVRSTFVYGSGPHVPDAVLQGGRSFRLVCDGRGSVRLAVDAATGEVVQRLDYDDLGAVVLDTAPGFQPFGFAGGLYDSATGLTRFGARDYDARTGRWTTPDPTHFRGGDTNLYGYCGQDPVNRADPRGTILPVLLGVGAGAVMSGVIDAGLRSLDGSFTWEDAEGVAMTVGTGLLLGGAGAGITMAIEKFLVVEAVQVIAASAGINGVIGAGWKLYQDLDYVSASPGMVLLDVAIAGLQSGAGSYFYYGWRGRENLSSVINSVAGTVIGSLPLLRWMIEADQRKRLRHPCRA